MLLNVTVFVRDSPDHAKRKLYVIVKEGTSDPDVRDATEPIAYLKSRGGEHQKAQANEDKNEDQHSVFLYVPVTFLEDLFNRKGDHRRRAIAME